MAAQRYHLAMRFRFVVLALASLVATPVVADPPATQSAPPAADPAQQPLSRAPSVAPYLVFDPPPPSVPSLRLEALRVAGERADNDWRYPTPEPIFGWQEDGFFIGYGHYRPRTARSAALHGGSIASTLLGQILLESGTPAAGVGMLLTGATLDAAAADVDRDAEARRRR